MNSIPEAFNRALDKTPLQLQPQAQLLWQSIFPQLSSLANRHKAAAQQIRENIGHLPRLLCGSEFCGRLLQHNPDLLLQVRSVLSCDIHANSQPLLDSCQRTLGGTSDETGFMQTLRKFRQQQMFIIAWNDLCLQAGLERTITSLSELADACLQVALQFAQTQISQRFGPILDNAGCERQLIVLALGKLGGRELNFSSDIDLILAFSEEDLFDDESRQSPHEYFIRVARKLVRYLDEVTADGFVFRVDLRLRPNGDSGPLVLSAGAMEHYYEGHGRDWERYALIKTRVIAGDLAAGNQLLKTLKPFVYRRYLDFGAIESIRDMKALIERQLKRRGMEHNIKLGPGGIREIEFIAQSMQLVHGGRQPVLQNNSLSKTLLALIETKLLQTTTAQQLLGHYRFLRDTEHRLQMWRDQQTQLLPQQAIEQCRLAYAMGSRDWDAFEQKLETTTDAVQRLFDDIFRRQNQQDTSNLQPLSALWLDGQYDDTATMTLQKIGYDDPQKICHELQSLRNGSLYRNLSGRGRQRLDRLVPQLIETAATTNDPESTLLRLLRLILAIGLRSVYFALLLEQPLALQKLCEICAASPWISNWIGLHPTVLDDLLRQASVPEPDTCADFSSMRHSLSNKLAAVAGDDVEAQLEVIREFRHSQVLLEAITAISGERAPHYTGRQLAAIAEAILCQCIVLVRQSLPPKYLPKVCENGKIPALGIVAYGKLGGRELGYSSDLDIVFLYETCDGDPDPVQTQYRFSRLVQRVIHLITLRTQGGQAYELDMRLRPSGNSGTLVTSFEAYAQYQLQQAWTWEHQALVRARLLGNNRSLTAHFERIRKKVLCQDRDQPQLVKDICHMRKQMRQHQDRSTAEHFDLKHGKGGLVDIEFMTQYLILAHAFRWPEIIAPRSTIDLLDALATTGAIDVTMASSLRETYRTYLGLEQRLKLHDSLPVINSAELIESRGMITQCWQLLFKDSDPASGENTSGSS